MTSISVEIVLNGKKPSEVGDRFCSFAQNYSEHRGKDAPHISVCGYVYEDDALLIKVRENGYEGEADALFRAARRELSDLRLLEYASLQIVPSKSSAKLFSEPEKFADEVCSVIEDAVRAAAEQRCCSIHGASAVYTPFFSMNEDGDISVCLPYCCPGFKIGHQLRQLTEPMTPLGFQQFVKVLSEA